MFSLVVGALGRRGTHQTMQCRGDGPPCPSANDAPMALAGALPALRAARRSAASVLAGGEAGSSHCRVPPGNGTALSKRLMRIAGPERSLLLRPFGRAPWELIRPAELFPERRRRAAPGARYFTGKDGPVGEP